MENGLFVATWNVSTTTKIPVKMFLANLDDDFRELNDSKPSEFTKAC